MAKKTKRANKKTRTAFWVCGAIALAFIAVYLFFAVRINLQRQGLEDVFKFLEQQGYTVNHGFSGIYQPGNIIQVAEVIEGREVPLAAPILVLSAKSCFPEKQPVKASYTLPHYSGTSTAGLKVGAKSVAALLPDLAFDSKTVADYSLKLGAIQTVAFEKLDLSHNFSDQCVHDLHSALADGDRIDWFKVIQEAVIADSLSFEIHWQSGISAEARKSLEKKIFREMTRMAQPSGKEGPAAQISSGVQVDTDKKMVMEAKGIVILAYKVRPLDKPENVARNDFPASKARIPDESPANISAETTDTQGNNAGRAKIAVQLIQESASRFVRFDHPFVKGDKFRFEIIPSRDGSLYIFHHKPGQSLELLWPRPEKILAGQQGQPVQRGRAVEIPPAPKNFYFDEELNEEHFYVAIAARQNQPSLRREIENFAVRGTDSSDNETRRVGYDPGQDPQDPYLYFSELLKESQGEVVEFRLGR